jgi:hypothetical protein
MLESLEKVKGVIMDYKFEAHPDLQLQSYQNLNTAVAAIRALSQDTVHFAQTRSYFRESQLLFPKEQ